MRAWCTPPGKQVGERADSPRVAARMECPPRTLVLTTPDADNRGVDGSLVVALVALVVGLAAVGAVIVSTRRGPGDQGSELRDGLRQDVQTAQQVMHGQVELLARSVGELRADLSRSLGATEQQLATQAG